MQFPYSVLSKTKPADELVHEEDPTHCFWLLCFLFSFLFEPCSVCWSFQAAVKLVGSLCTTRIHYLHCSVACETPASIPMRGKDVLFPNL